MERKIGEIFEYNGEWYQCLKSESCSECDFLNSNCIDNLNIKCGIDDRTDNCSVVFKELEKVGEPFSDYCPSGRVIYISKVINVIKSLYIQGI